MGKWEIGWGKQELPKGQVGIQVFVEPGIKRKLLNKVFDKVITGTKDHTDWHNSACIHFA